MKQEDIDQGTLDALLKRFTDYRLPRAQRMLARVNEGQKLTDRDLRFLKRIKSESAGRMALLQRNPEYMKITSAFIDLYSEIIHKATENERSG